MNRRALIGSMVATPIVGVVGWRAPASDAQGADPVGTIAALQTRVADLKTSVAKRDAKIDALETQIATGPTATATQVPSSNQGSFDIWDVVVDGAVFRPNVGSGDGLKVALGTFLVIDYTLTNNGNQPERRPDHDLIVEVDGQRTYGYALEATISIFIYERGGTVIDDVQPGLPTPEVIVFDVPASGSSYRLTDESGQLDIVLQPRTA